MKRSKYCFFHGIDYIEGHVCPKCQKNDHNADRNREKPRRKCSKDGTEYIKEHGCPVCKK